MSEDFKTHFVLSINVCVRHERIEAGNKQNELLSKDIFTLRLILIENFCGQAREDSIDKFFIKMRDNVGSNKRKESFDERILNSSKIERFNKSSRKLYELKTNEKILLRRGLGFPC